MHVLVLASEMEDIVTCAASLLLGGSRNDKVIVQFSLVGVCALECWLGTAKSIGTVNTWSNSGKKSW